MNKPPHQQELKRIISVLVKKYQPLKIILFGSILTDKTHQWSDLDLAIIKKTNKRFADRIGEVLALTEPKVPTDFLVYTPEEFEKMSQYNYFIQDEILKKGKILYEQNE